MKKSILFLFLCFLAFNGISQQTINTSITHDGQQREYILYVPASYDGNTAVPLLLCFHGYTSNNSIIMTYSNFNNVADTADILVAYPLGTEYGGATHWNVGGWTTGSTTDDVGFVDALLDSLNADYNIDTDRVYSAGMSNGGYMSFLLACQLSDRIAAISSITGSMTTETFDSCNPQHPTPVLQIHGDADGTVPYQGASWTKSIPDVLSYWSSYNNNGVIDTTAISDINTSDGSTVDEITYDYGDNCVLVKHFKVYSGDHDWPGAWGNMDIKATNESWNFLRQFDINGISGCMAGINKNEIETTLEVYPSPAEQFVTVKTNKKQAEHYQIIDLSGRVIDEGTLLSSNSTIDISKLSANIYILQVGSSKVKFIKR